MVNETQDVEALDRLESRVLEMVEQLREARRQLAASEDEAAQLRQKLSAAEERVRAVEGERTNTQAGRDEVRRRIEALIGRIESMES